MRLVGFVPASYVDAPCGPLWAIADGLPPWRANVVGVSRINFYSSVKSGPLTPGA